MNDRKLTRHEMREAALLILFQMQLNSGTLQEIIEDCEETFELLHTKDSVKLVNGVIEHNDELTQIISGYSPSRSVDRISVINMVIMKIAIYEMKYCDNVPDKVAINEAVEFSKEYAEKNDVSFINGVLNSYLKDKNKDA
ncbi:MAG: transcription antitermination factor NusB [Ruminococcaceae bacterium]|nr:transcription antitermination factor NusB [Oscillospiraceae bacterium]